MSRAERLRKLAELEERLKVKRKPRVYSFCTNTQEWMFGSGPPGGVPRDGDTVVHVTFMHPTGEYGGRPSTPEELAAARDRADDVAPGHRHHDTNEAEAYRP